MAPLDHAITTRPAAPATEPDEGGAGGQPSASATAKDAAGGQSIRVSVDLLEQLMTTVSELVLTRNQLLQILRHHKDSEFLAPLQRLGHVTSELQEGVMKTRMQPVSNAWGKLPRLVRDLALELGKKIELQMIGGDTELDRQVLELIKDPIAHMVRNAADHGIETPERRLAVGKPEAGRIRLTAYHEGGHIIIEIADDGRGLDSARIRAQVLAKGLATEAELAAMSEQKLQSSILRPGFSSSAAAGGVGMDVVRANIEKIGGAIDLHASHGKGLTFAIKIPLTLAIVSAIILESCGERFALPQTAVIELVHASGQSEHRVERINGSPVLRLRDRLLPLVSLERLLRLERTDAGLEERFIIVAQSGANVFGIMVDRVFDTEEIVVKPVPPILSQTTAFSGNTILGDGSVIMILDPNGLAAGTGELVHAEAAAPAEGVARAGAEDRTTLLIVRAGPGGPKAVPLALIARLEEFDVAAIEQSQGRNMVQYRDRLMPLVTVDDAQALVESGRQPVLVFADGDRVMGLAVDAIIDIVEDRLAVELASSRPGFIGSAIVGGRATDLIDVGYFLPKAFDDWFAADSARALGRADGARQILLVEDSAFFRNLMTPMLSVAGYHVTAACNGQEALVLCRDGSFEAIVSDIEMPGMDGLAFAAALRQQRRWQDTPLIALTARNAPDDVARARAAGFQRHVAKSDRDALVGALDELFSQGARI